MWVTIASPNTTVNIRDASPNAVARTLLSDARIPVGTYDNFKLVMSETMVIQGSATPGATFYTNSGASVILTGLDNTADKISTWGGLPNVRIDEQAGTNSVAAAAGASGEVAYLLNLDSNEVPADSIIEVYKLADLATPITVTADSLITFAFTFDTSTAAVYLPAGALGGGTDIGADGAMVYLPPSMGTSFSITVDGVTTTIAAAQMEFEF